jgi:hypothetical protein
MAAAYSGVIKGDGQDTPGGESAFMASSAVSFILLASDQRRIC